MHKYDIIAIGGGAAGLVTAGGAAGLGARVALIERHKMGGECLWTGCVPSKALLAAARAAASVRAASRFGVDAGAPAIEFKRVMEHVHGAQNAIAPHDSPDRFRSLGVDVFEGTANFIDRSHVDVEGKILTARHVVIATGSRPVVPPIDGIDTVSFHTNETIFTVDSLPASIVVLGAGAVGVELAQAFALLGSTVTIIEATAHILQSEDQEVAEAMRTRLQRDGVDVRAGVKVDRVERTAAGVRVHTPSGAIEATTLLVAAGRRANTDTLSLEAAGVACSDQGLELDDYLRTTAKNVWGAGDVTGAPRFTHVADYHARLILRNALFPLKAAANYSKVPWAIYTHPEIAHVGLTEAQAREQHGSRVRVWRKSLCDLDRAVADGTNEGFVKIITDARGHILGGHVLGHHASSVLAEISLAMQQNIPLSKLASVMHAYPTYPESVKHIADMYMRSRFTGLAQKAAGWLVRR